VGNADLWDAWVKQGTTKKLVELEAFKPHLKDSTNISVKIAPLPKVRKIEDFRNLKSPKSFRRQYLKGGHVEMQYTTLSPSYARKLEAVAEHFGMSFELKDSSDVITTMLEDLAKEHKNPVILYWGPKVFTDAVEKTSYSPSRVVESGNGKGKLFSHVVEYQTDFGPIDLVRFPTFPYGELAKQVVEAYVKHSDLEGVAFISSAGTVGEFKNDILFPGQSFKYSINNIHEVSIPTNKGYAIVTVDHILEEGDEFRTAMENQLMTLNSHINKALVDCEMAYVWEGLNGKDIPFFPLYYKADQIDRLEPYDRTTTNKNAKQFLASCFNGVVSDMALHVYQKHLFPDLDNI